MAVVWKPNHNYLCGGFGATPQLCVWKFGSKPPSLLRLLGSQIITSCVGHHYLCGGLGTKPQLLLCPCAWLGCTMSYVWQLRVALRLLMFAMMAESCSALVPVMAHMEQPKSRAPEVSVDHFVESIKHGLGFHNLMQISTRVLPSGSWLGHILQGQADYKRNLETEQRTC